MEHMANFQKGRRQSEGEVGQRVNGTHPNPPAPAQVREGLATVARGVTGVPHYIINDK